MKPKKPENPNRFIGCCGAYCKTCRPFIDGYCRGCKLGYAKDKRDITKIKCKIKQCCFAEKKLETCADCKDLDSCNIIGEFRGKISYKYGKYLGAVKFIRKNGYGKFLKFAEKWNGAYGKLE